MRYVLLIISTLAVLALSADLIFLDKSFNVLLLVLLTLMALNTFYIFISRPILKISDVLLRASDGLALASLELQHQADEVRLREIETENRRLEEAQYQRDKLQTAKDILKQMSVRVSLDRKETTSLPQIADQSRLSDPARTTQPSAPPVVAAPQRLNGLDSGAKPDRLVAQAGSAR